MDHVLVQVVLRRDSLLTLLLDGRSQKLAEKGQLGRGRRLLLLWLLWAERQKLFFAAS